MYISGVIWVNTMQDINLLAVSRFMMLSIVGMQYIVCCM